MRLDKFLAHTGFGTRKGVKGLIKGKQVMIGDTIAKDGKQQVKPDVDTVYVRGEAVKYQEFIYLMMHKPQGVVSATIDNVSQTVIELLQPEEQLVGPFPVGRLDKDTEGLLLITNDGTLAHNLLSPKKHVDKCYQATISGIVTKEQQDRFKMGIILKDGFNCQPAELEIIEVDDAQQQSEIKITIHEGKFHQVKRMFEAVEQKVIYLKRLSMGPLKLDEQLALGEYRPLTEAELELLTEYK
ncbi:pseudouridine synthase [Carnobacterium gallinarum]|uniref:pseudouridine synthase n=1 Tax=Carnobacterium gallinarum TaxID=2749 RepID=UPI0005500D16|nr:pseudouridine synthase [Carnobacterium gallinarum]